MIYKEYDFNLCGIEKIERSKYREGMPVVYILYNNKEAYIGQTTNFKKRMIKHIKDTKKSRFKKILMITDKTFNKSVIEDIEAELIKCMGCDGKFKIKNIKQETETKYYYKKEEYQYIIDIIWPGLYRRDLVNYEIQKIKNMNTFKLSPYTVLIKEQYIVANKIINKDLKKNDKISVYGLGGTGKTVLAIHILKELVDKNSNLKIKFVVPTRTFRATVRKVFSKTAGLDKDMVIAPNQLKRDDNFDILIVDEAQRLRRYKNLSSGEEYKKFKLTCENLDLDYETSNELDWIKKCSNKQIIFYDYAQKVKPTDIKREDLERFVNESKNYILKSQLRCQGGNNYIDFVIDLLNCTIKDSKIREFGNYDLKVFNTSKEMKQEIAKKEKQFGLCRRVSGICFKWDRKNKPKFKIGNTEEKWNTKTDDWINSKDAFKELGCIHTVQGYDLNYCAVIFGKEIDYDKDSNVIVINKNEYLDNNGKKGEDDKEIRKNILGIYYTMLTRGIRGTYIYAMNENLREYLKKYIQTFNESKDELFKGEEKIVNL